MIYAYALGIQIFKHASNRSDQVHTFNVRGYQLIVDIG